MNTHLNRAFFWPLSAGGSPLVRRRGVAPKGVRRLFRPQETQAAQKEAQISRPVDDTASVTLCQDTLSPVRLAGGRAGDRGDGGSS
jgi:hypothetical protein